EFEVGGMPTVLPFHRAVVTDPAFAGEPLRVHTRWIETEFDTPMPPQEPAEVVVPAALGGSRRTDAAAVSAERAPGARRGRRKAHAAGGATLVSPMQGTIIKIEVAEGQRVSADDVVVVLEAMKMEQPLTAHKAGTITGLSVTVGQTVTAGAAICSI